MAYDSDTHGDSTASPTAQDAPGVASPGESAQSTIPPVGAAASPVSEDLPEPDADPDAPYGRKADGTPRAKPGRKKEGEASAAQRERLGSVTRPPPRPQQAPATAPAPAIVRADYKQVGRSFASIWFTVGCLIFGDEWAPAKPTPPDTQGEAEVVAVAFENWARSKDMQVMDPTLALCITLLTYAGVRATRPTIKARFIGIWLWSKNQVIRLIPKRR